MGAHRIMIVKNGAIWPQRTCTYMNALTLLELFMSPQPRHSLNYQVR